MWYLYLIVGIVSFFIGSISILLLCPVCGTLYVDMDSTDDRDIARFIFDKTFEDIVGYKVMTLRIEKRNDLNSINGKV